MIDIDDDDAVLEDMADALDVDVDELSVEPRSKTSVEVSMGSNTFTVWESEEAAAEEMLEYVKDQLRDDGPEAFNIEWVQGFIDQEKLSKAVYDMAMEDDYAEELAKDPKYFWKEAERYGVGDLPEEDEYGDMPDEVDDKYVEELKEAIAESRAKKPQEYLDEVFGEVDAAKWAMTNVGIDVDAAADDAISTDGWQHFSGSYDGNYYETAHDLVYVQTGGNGNKGRSSSVPNHMRPSKF